MSDDFSYEDFSSVEDGIERYKKKQNIKIYGRKARVFSRYARYFFIGIIVLGILAIFLAYAWHLMKKERIVFKNIETEIINDDLSDTITLTDEEGNQETVKMMSEVTHFKTVPDKKIGDVSYDIVTRWEYKNASNAKIGAYPESQSCYARYNKNTLLMHIELFQYQNGIIKNVFNNSELPKHNLSLSDINKLKKYCNWKS